MVQKFRGRRATSIENETLRITVLHEGGHIAEVFHKGAAISPLWIPPWPSIEPSTYDPARDSAYGEPIEAPLLSGIMGHNLCLDTFGPPSSEEARTGLPVHGEMSIAHCIVVQNGDNLVTSADLPASKLKFERHLRLFGNAIRITEVVKNDSPTDRPIAWTQHVTLGPPFLKPGKTKLCVSAVRGKVFETEFGSGDYLKAGSEFEWPRAPLRTGGNTDLQLLREASCSSAFTAQLMNTDIENAFCLAFAPELEFSIGFIWRQQDFPWLGLWEENRSRTSLPWNGETLALGLEFGVSPFPESRRKMIDRGRLFGIPTYRWIPAKSEVTVEYWTVAQQTRVIPETINWPAP